MTNSDYLLKAAIKKVTEKLNEILVEKIEEAKNNSRKAFVAGANEKVKDRLAKFGVEGIIETRKEALETALNEIAS